MEKKSVLMAFLAIVAALSGVNVAAEVDLKVDFALPKWTGGGIWTDTAKPGWVPWAPGGFGDMMLHDYRLTENLGGTGIDASITVVAEGRGCLKVKGLCMGDRDGGAAPVGLPEGGPIANSWYYAFKFSYRPKSNVILTFYKLPGGEYELTSYHNYWQPCSRAERDCTDCEPNDVPPMPVIKAMSFADGFEWLEWLAENDLHTVGQFTDAFNKIRGPAGPEYGVNVAAIQDAYNVKPSSVYEDDEVTTSLVRFATDGSPVMIMYEAPEYEGDNPIDYMGGRGVLNAFHLRMVEATLTAGMPLPFDGAVDVPRNKVFSWSPGIYAVEHDVYLGTNGPAVENAVSPDVPPGRGRQIQTTYDPGVLELGTTYYWRIDEVNDAEVDSPWKGQVWSFTTKDCDSVDGFESYADSDALQAVWDIGGGGWIELSTDNQQSGAKSLELAYYNRSGNKYSATEIEFAEPDNLVASGVSSIGLHFKGVLSNQTDRLYVTLEDAAAGSATVAYDGDPNDLKSDNWQQWRIELTEFGGVDPTAVEKLIIGVGDKDADRSSGASGTLYVDDVGFCGGGGAVGCPCPGDLNGDDQIDLDDLQAVAGILLNVGSPFIAPVPPAPDCAELTGDDQADLDDLQAVASILLDAGSPFIVPCK